MASAYYRLDMSDGFGPGQVMMYRDVFTDDASEVPCISPAVWTNPHRFHPRRRNEMRVLDGYRGVLSADDCVRCISPNEEIVDPNGGDCHETGFGVDLPNALAFDWTGITAYQGEAAWDAGWQYLIDQSCVPLSVVPTPTMDFFDVSTNHQDWELESFNRLVPRFEGTFINTLNGDECGPCWSVSKSWTEEWCPDGDCFNANGGWNQRDGFGFLLRFLNYGFSGTICLEPSGGAYRLAAMIRHWTTISAFDRGIGDVRYLSADFDPATDPFPTSLDILLCSGISYSGNIVTVWPWSAIYNTYLGIATWVFPAQSSYISTTNTNYNRSWYYFLEFPTTLTIAY